MSWISFTPSCFSLFVQFDECFLVLSTISVIVLSIHNPHDFVEKFQGVEQQWFLQRISGIVLGYVPHTTNFFRLKNLF